MHSFVLSVHLQLNYPKVMRLNHRVHRVARGVPDWPPVNFIATFIQNTYFFNLNISITVGIGNSERRICSGIQINRTEANKFISSQFLVVATGIGQTAKHTEHQAD
jgi:hypothetical protein